MPRITYLDRDPASLLFLQLDDQRIIENQEIFASKVVTSQPNLSKSLSCGSEHKQSSPKKLRPKILKLVEERVLEIAPGDALAVQAVKKIFQSRFDSHRNFDLKAAVSEANATLDGVSPTRSFRGIAMVASSILILSVLIILILTKQSSRSPRTKAQLSSPDQYRVLPQSKVILFLQNPTSDYSRSSNKVIQRYLDRMLASADINEIQVLVPNPDSPVTDATAAELQDEKERLAVFWLELDELPQGKRVYINYCSSNKLVENGQTQVTMPAKTLLEFNGIDELSRGIFVNVVSELLGELARVGDYDRLKTIMSSTYENDSVIKARHPFSPFEVDMAASMGHFDEALRLLEKVIAQPSIVTTESHRRVLKEASSQQRAVLLFRLNRYEEAYLLLKDRIPKSSDFRLFTSESGVAASSTGVIFFDLHYPASVGILYRPEADTLMVLDAELGNNWNTSLASGDSNHYLSNFCKSLETMKSNVNDPGVYYSKSNRQSGQYGTFMDLTPSRIRSVKAVPGW